LGAVQEVGPDADGRQVLWLAGTRGDMLASAADALYDPRLAGRVEVVDAAGRLSPLLGPEAGAPGVGPGGPSTGLLLVGAGAVLLLGVVALQLRRPRRWTT
jgi:hypothetical protein